MERIFLRLIFLLFVIAPAANAYTVVTISSAAPVGLEKQFLASTTAQFSATLFKNPLASNTYALNLIGMNPNFNPLPTNADLLNAVVTVDSWTYVMGWANASSYQQYVDLNIIGDFSSHCSSPSYFSLIQTSSTTFDANTCGDVARSIYNVIFQQSASTPTVVPGGF